MESSRSESRDRPISADPPRRLPLMAGPTVWYALAGLSIIISLCIFLLAAPADQVRRYAIAIFIGLWAPMFGLLAIRAELMELREDLSRKAEQKRGR